MLSWFFSPFPRDYLVSLRIGVLDSEKIQFKLESNFPMRVSSQERFIGKNNFLPLFPFISIPGNSRNPVAQRSLIMGFSSFTVRKLVWCCTQSLYVPRIWRKSSWCLKCEKWTKWWWNLSRGLKDVKFGDDDNDEAMTKRLGTFSRASSIEAKESWMREWYSHEFSRFSRFS